MTAMTPSVLRLARTLVALEAGEPSCEERARAAFQVCGQLHGILAPLVGQQGIQALFSRALKLATREIPWLGGVRLRDDSTVDYVEAVTPTQDPELGPQGGELLLAYELCLLLILIGKGLTMQMVRETWPEARAAGDLDLEDNS